MPTFTAIALDALIEPKASEIKATAGEYTPASKLNSRSTTPSSHIVTETSLPKWERGMNLPPAAPRIEREESVSTTKVHRKHHWARISPALYTTPAPTPLPVVPDSPTSVPPSPYVINHKRRGPRLKSFSEDDIVVTDQVLEADKAAEENGTIVEKEVFDSDNFDFPIVVGDGNGVSDGEFGSDELSNGQTAQISMKSTTLDGLRDAEHDDFLDPHDSVSVKSNSEGESSGRAEKSFSLTTPIAEFYDAWEELSSESGAQLPQVDVEAELHEIRSSLLMETEKRKQAEESLWDFKSRWLKMQQQLSAVGLTLPADLTNAVEAEHMADPAEELCQQVHLARYVSNSIGRGSAKAEAEIEMEAQLEAKNFEITRLWDRLNYYEAVNREMFQRNQEVVDTARRRRQSRKRRHKWYWGSISVAITLGAAALAWSYLPTGKGSSLSNPSHAPEGVGSSC